MKKLLPTKQFIGIPFDAKQGLRMVQDTPRNVYTFWYLDEDGFVRRNSYSEVKPSVRSIMQMQAAEETKDRLTNAILQRVRIDLQGSFPGLHITAIDTELELRDFDSLNSYYQAVFQESLGIYNRPLTTLMVAAKPRLQEDGSYRFAFSFPSFVSYEMICCQKEEIKQVVADYISKYAATHRQFANGVLRGEAYKDVPPIFTPDHQLVYLFEPKTREQMISFPAKETFEYAM